MRQTSWGQRVCRYKRQRGQAMAEFAVVAAFVLVPMSLGMAFLAKLGDSRHQMHEAARYAAWERTVWSAADPRVNHKANSHVLNETLARVVGEPAAPLDSKADRLDVKPADRKFAPLLYVADSPTGKRRAIFREDKGKFMDLAFKDDKALAGKAAKAFGSLAARGLSVSDKGLQTSTFSWEHEWIPALDFGQPRLSVGSHNTIMTESWNAGSPQEAKRRIKRMVATSLLANSTVKKGLSAMSKLGFKEFKQLDLGKIDVDRVPCQRLTNLTKRPKC
ncbi:TadE/TadG family type IV pilus assembly protein [Marinobacter salicampi]|uniref:TadE/TadG family type IV pilus assembly protein n=1 Tax=Marinobacter salicampi TaxID=435907 RepID=UPI001408A1C3|nr:TadE family protein [Marinobacter salicampi]